MNNSSFILILSSPSGAGKTSLAKKILENDPSFKTSVSVTTRPKRPSEVEGKDYFFVNKEQFNELIKKMNCLSMLLYLIIYMVRRNNMCLIN